MELHPNISIETLDVDGTEASDSPAPHLIATDRLVLHRVHADGVEFEPLHTLFADVRDATAVFEQCGWERHENEAETRAYLDRQTASWERAEKYEYVLETAAGGEYVGTTCIEPDADDGACEFGLWLRKPH
jgi:hypothetical protein